MPLHPTQIYLSLNAFLIFLVLQWAYRRRSFDGEVFWLYVLLYAITRGILETFRGDSVRGFLIPGVLSTSQFIGLVAAAAAVGMLVFLSAVAGDRARRRDAAGSASESPPPARGSTSSSCQPARTSPAPGSRS